MGHAGKNVEARRRPAGIEELPRPRRQLAIGIAILRRDELDEIGKFLVVVDEGIEIGLIVRRQRELFRRIVLDGDGGGECQRRGARLEGRDRDAVVEDVVDPAQRGGLRLDLERARQHAQIVARQRTQHDPVLAERHRVGVAIFGLVVNRQDRLSVAIIVILADLIQRDICSFPGRHAASVGN